jgi:carbon monoxide dehydrogenase subunit G
MELTNDFRVGVSVPEAWKVLTDVERIAPMMPGAQLQEVEGEEYRGVVKVKVGPITAQYKGQATFVERDEAAGRVVLKASGRDTRGQGNANALITATMTPDGDATKVSVVTDLTITGKVAQFGRGVLAEVSSKLIGQFVDALEADIEASGHGTDATTPVVTPDNGAVAEADSGPSAAMSDGAASTSGVRTISGPEAEPVDLLAVSKDSVVKRLWPLVVVAAVVVFVLARRRARG